MMGKKVFTYNNNNINNNDDNSFEVSEKMDNIFLSEICLTENGTQ